MTREQFITHVEGSQKAFRRFLVALCSGDAALADDIAQESYIKAYLSCDAFNNPEKFKGWIFRIGYNTYINHKRRERIFVDCNEISDVITSEDSDNYQPLYEALSKLSKTERTSILLFYMEGYSIKEIASIVEASEDAVKQHLSRGRKHLRNLISCSKI